MEFCCKIYIFCPWCIDLESIQASRHRRQRHVCFSRHGWAQIVERGTPFCWIHSEVKWGKKMRNHPWTEQASILPAYSGSSGNAYMTPCGEMRVKLCSETMHKFINIRKFEESKSLRIDEISIQKSKCLSMDRFASTTPGSMQSTFRGLPFPPRFSRWWRWWGYKVHRKYCYFYNEHAQAHMTFTMARSHGNSWRYKTTLGRVSFVSTPHIDLGSLALVLVTESSADYVLAAGKDHVWGSYYEHCLYLWTLHHRWDRTCFFALCYMSSSTVISW